MERHNFHVLSLLSAQKLDSFLVLLQRLREDFVKRHFDCWKHAYTHGYLDMPSLVSSSEDEEAAPMLHVVEALSDSDEE